VCPLIEQPQLQWNLRQDMLREANARLVNAHHPHQLAQLWGGGTLSSSDGQRFSQCGRNLTTRALSRYFLDEGTTTYAQVSDQHSTYGTKVIPTTWREAVEALCLTLVTNATVLWTSASPRYVVDALRADGYHVTDEAAAHLTPAPHDHINFYGTYSFDVETELTAKNVARSAHQPPEFPGTRRRDQFHSVTKGTPNTAMVPGPIAPSCAQNERNYKCRNKFGTTEMTCQLACHE
jgi:Tn3 transposase DDE domain